MVTMVNDGELPVTMVTDTDLCNVDLCVSISPGPRPKSPSVRARDAKDGTGLKSPLPWSPCSSRPSYSTSPSRSVDGVAEGNIYIYM